MVDIEDIDDDNNLKDSEANEVYDEQELQPGGSGKQGDQQQMGQDREIRRDKSHNEGGTDKLHGR